jgi:tryptophan synthase beta subunit
MPALEAAHALAALFKRHDIESHSNVVVCISGHGDSKARPPIPLCKCLCVSFNPP